MDSETGSACRLSGSSDDLETIKKILAYKTIAVVGCSPKPERPSHSVAAYLKEEGYKIIPVNPGHKEILGEKCSAGSRDCFVCRRSFKTPYLSGDKFFRRNF